jgi:predicted DNA-binding protein
MTVTLNEYDSAVVYTLAQQTGKTQNEILHEAIELYMAKFQSKHQQDDTVDLLSDEELTLAAEAIFLQLDAEELEETYA